MSSNVQSIVCCLGDPVAGNPTQFLMQRAAMTLGLDWMFVTSEVSEERLHEAFQGIRALRFSGVAFLRPHQKAASKLVDSLTEAAIRSGQVRVARRDGDAWLGDDTLGMAIVELLATHPELKADQSTHRILCAGQEWMPHLIRLARPDWGYRIMKWNSPNEEPVPIVEESTLLEPAPPGLGPTVAEPPAYFGTLIVDNTAPPISAKQLAKLFDRHKNGRSEVPSNLTIVFVQPNNAWESAIAKLDYPNKHIYRSFDVAAAKATVNFQFWTGQGTEFSSIRDALDEYCQW